MALTVLSGHSDGAQVLLRSTIFLENLAMVIEDPSPAVRIKAATLLEMLTKNWMGNIDLIKNCSYIDYKLFSRSLRTCSSGFCTCIA